jgi:2-polyprenyl-6-methoxyphenol hydroxylase-like FAD-dependent oxidoreductase
MRADEAPPGRYEPPTLIHRADLIDILLRPLPRDILKTAAKVRRVRNGNSHAAVEHDRGRDSAPLVVGADGTTPAPGFRGAALLGRARRDATAFWQLA